MLGVDSPPVSVLTYEEWVSGRVPALLRFAYLVTRSQDAAEEAVQAALTDALRHWDRVRRTHDPDAYVRRMVVNAHVSASRRWGRRESAVAEVRERGHGDPADAGPAPETEWVVLSVGSRTYVVHMSLRGCAFVDGGDKRVKLTRRWQRPGPPAGSRPSSTARPAARAA